MNRPVGVAHGASALGVAWLIACAIALLTGASAVVILIAVGLVAFVASLLSGWTAIRHISVDAVTTADLADAESTLTWHVHANGTRRAHAELRIAEAVVARGWVAPGSTLLSGSAPGRGVHTSVQVRLSSAGTLGIVWWRRRSTIGIEPLFVAPTAALEPAPHQRPAGHRGDNCVTSSATGRDEVDGVRSWREGDELTAVHWPATLRTGEFVVRQRLHDLEERWVVQARSRTGDSGLEAARARTTLEEGLAVGARVAVQVDAHEPTALRDRAAVLRWCAAFEAGEGPGGSRPHTPFWQRPLAIPSPEPESSLTSGARWAVAVAAAAPPVMLLEPLGYGPIQIAVVLAAVAAGAYFSMRGPHHQRLLRQALGLLTGVAVALSLVDLSAVDSIATSLRFLLPQTLVALVVMQGFECTDRRSARVSLACSAMLTAYAAGIRVDERLVVWLAVSLAGLTIGSHAVAHIDRRPPAATGRSGRTNRRLVVTRAVAVVGAASAVLAVLAVVRVPEGPAQLTLPSWLQEYRPTPSDGELVAADGSPLLGGAAPGGSRSGAGAGGYPGFSPTMDTSLRGALGDEVVLRVRAPYADFWRGQTFTQFDGRVWRVDEATGELTEGPDHDVRLAPGDVSTKGDDQFIQTFYAEVDLPNIVFAASRADRVLLAAPMWARPDGALRAQVVIPAGSAYTVVSQRSGATADGLRAEGDISQLASPIEFVYTPASTTDRTRALAEELAGGASSTYDVILAIQAWLRTHVTYNLEAPVPPSDADAVDHFLFESQQGFCEQIASATAMLLRSLGIPARIATGYVPSERDEVAGVWISRASDAHAWVEVRFPNFGWIAFDPTAAVPLAGEATRTTIGGDLAKAVAGLIGDHIAVVLTSLLLVAAITVVGKLVVGWWRRRRRGRWGVLQDRFVSAALQRGAPLHAPNARLADVFDQRAAQELAATLDASAFAAEWADDDTSYHRALDAISELERSA